MKQVRKLRTCDCGFPLTNRSHRYHRRSVYHRHYRRIKDLLSEDSLTFTEIGERFGITRETLIKLSAFHKRSS
jgi:hypothetical protein